MKKLLFVLSLIGSISVISCKKDKEEVVPPPPVVPVKTTAEKVLGRWNITNFIENDYYNNTNHRDTTPGITSDYLEFKNNGKLLIKVSFAGSGVDSVFYNVLNDSTIIIDGESNKIKELTASKFVLYSKDVYSTNPLEFYEFTINLFK